MKHVFIFTSRVVKDVEKLDEFTKKRLAKSILRLQGSPLTHAEKLIDSALGGYRWRVGDYRVIFDLVGREIVVLRVGHRREIYRR